MLTSTQQKCFIEGHFGELLQGRLGENGPVALITLPCPQTGVEVEWHPDQPFAVCDAGHIPMIARDDIGVIFKALDAGPARGSWHFRSRFPAGCGTGASTAARLGVSRLLAGDGTPPERLAQLILSLEGATDPLMFARPMTCLWAPREARMLADLPQPPILRVIGGLWSPPRPTDPADLDFPGIGDLVEPWQEACLAGDLSAIGAIAHMSARRCIRHRGGPDLAPFDAICRETGALGVALAHTGSTVGLLYPPDFADISAVSDGLKALDLQHITSFVTPS